MRSKSPAACASLALAALLALSGSVASGKTSKPKAPVSGESIFAKNCVRCHGPGARGDIGPDLRGTDLPVSELRDTVESGVPREMPAFAGKLSAAEITSVVSYIKGLTVTPPTCR